MELFVIERTTPMRNLSRNTRGEVCEIRFRELEEAERPDVLMSTLIQHLLDRVCEGRAPPLLVGLQLHPPGFDRPFVVRLRPQSRTMLKRWPQRLSNWTISPRRTLIFCRVARWRRCWQCGPSKRHVRKCSDLVAFPNKRMMFAKHFQVHVIMMRNTLYRTACNRWCVL